MLGAVVIALAFTMILFGFFGRIYHDLLNGTLTFGPRTRIFFALMLGFLGCLGAMLVESRRHLAAEEAAIDERIATQRAQTQAAERESEARKALAVEAAEPVKEPAPQPVTTDNTGPKQPPALSLSKEKVHEFVAKSDRDIERTNQIIAEADTVLKQIDDEFEESLRFQLVPSGKFSLCYVRPEKPDTLIEKLEHHWADRNVAKRVEQRDEETVTVWTNLEEKYANEYCDGFKKLNLRAWVEKSAAK